MNELFINAFADELEKLARDGAAAFANSTNRAPYNRVANQTTMKSERVKSTARRSTMKRRIGAGAGLAAGSYLLHKTFKKDS
jgi:hypothetical protein